MTAPQAGSPDPQKEPFPTSRVTENVNGRLFFRQCPPSQREIAGFEADLGYRLIFSPGALRQVGEAAIELGSRRVLLVSDRGVKEAGHVESALGSLGEAGLQTFVFDRAEENPTSMQIVAAADRASGFAPDLIIGLGGGSAMDCAKGVNFVLTNGGRMEDYWGFAKASRPLLPSIGVPTTAGTGSEAQSYAVITQDETGRKMACGDRQARFRTVILDPDLIATAPRHVRALAAVDALSHAVESHVSGKATPISRIYSRQAWLWIEANLEVFLGDGESGQARACMLLAAHLAGLAIENSMLGAAHACANPLTARFAVSHGAAVGLMLPHVVRFNRSAAQEGYSDLRRVVEGRCENNLADGEWLAERIAGMLRTAELPQRLRDHSVSPGDFPELARLAVEEWTGRFNPRKIEKDDFERLYSDAF